MVSNGWRDGANTKEVSATVPSTCLGLSLDFSSLCEKFSTVESPPTRESLTFALINTVTESSSSIARVGFEQCPLPMISFTDVKHLEPQAADDLLHLTLNLPLDGKLARTAGHKPIVVVVVLTLVFEHSSSRDYVSLGHWHGGCDGPWWLKVDWRREGRHLHLGLAIAIRYCAHFPAIHRRRVCR